MLVYFLIALNLCGVISYQYTGNVYTLFPSALYIVYNMYNFVKINALVLSPAWEVELDLHESTPLREKIVLQISTLLILHLFYQSGYEFFAGAAAAVSLCFIASFLATYFGSYPKDDEEEKDKGDEE